MLGDGPGNEGYVDEPPDPEDEEEQETKTARGEGDPEEEEQRLTDDQYPALEQLLVYVLRVIRSA